MILKDTFCKAASKKMPEIHQISVTSIGLPPWKYKNNTNTSNKCTFKGTKVLNVSLFSFTGIIHGDLSDQNIIVTPIANGHHEISGIIDFSLLMNGCYVFELAITIMYLMLENPNPLDVGGPLIAGWESIMPLSDDERDSLYLLVLGRLCQSLVYGQYYSRKYPDNKEYILTTARNGFQMLAKLWELGKEEVERKWFSDASTFSVNN